MPNLNWSLLEKQQLGRYAEYYAKMEFASYGFEVYTSEVDDHGVDFIAKLKNSDFFEVQVKGVSEGGTCVISKEKLPIDKPNFLVCYLSFSVGKLPQVYLIPATAWKQPNAAFKGYDYDKPGQTSKPEWGINYSKKNLPLLEPYKIENFIGSIMD